MKALKLLLFGLFLIFGSIIAYFAFIAFDGGNPLIALLYGILSVILVCVGFVGIVLLLTRKNEETMEESTFVPVTVVSKGEQDSFDTTTFSASTNLPIKAEPNETTVSKQEPSFQSIHKVDLSLRPISVSEVRTNIASDLTADLSTTTEILVDSEPDPILPEPLSEAILEPEPEIIQPKEDPHFLFGDWWVDADGLYIDVRLIGITGRKQQRTLRKLAEGASLTYDADLRKETVALLYGKTTIGYVPEIYRKTILIYADGIASASIARLVRKRRDTLQCDVRIRFDDELRERLQKKLQLDSWK